MSMKIDFYFFNAHVSHPSSQQERILKFMSSWNKIFSCSRVNKKCPRAKMFQVHSVKSSKVESLHE